MPTYQYACKQSACGHRFEAVQSFSDDPIAVCPVCQGEVRKVFSAVGVVFKGSGFYRNDSREPVKSSAGKDATAPKESGSDAGSGSGSTEKKAESSSSTSSDSGSGSSGAKSTPSSSGSTSTAAAS